MTAPKKSKNIEITYEDLTGKTFGITKVVNRITPVKEPELLNNTSWRCVCTACGRERNVSGRLLYFETFRPCPCQKDVKELTAENAGIPVGRGLVYAMNNDPERFTSYLKRRQEESLNSKGLPNNYIKKLRE